MKTHDGVNHSGRSYKQAGERTSKKTVNHVLVFGVRLIYEMFRFRSVYSHAKSRKVELALNGRRLSVRTGFMIETDH